MPQRLANLGAPPGPRGDAERSRTSSDPLPLWGKIQSIFEVHLHSECFLSQGISRNKETDLFNFSDEKHPRYLKLDSIFFLNLNLRRLLLKLRAPKASTSQAWRLVWFSPKKAKLAFLGIESGPHTPGKKVK